MKYEFDYILPNGTRLHYQWEPARVGRRSIVEIEDQAFEYMKYNTVTLINRKLVIVDEDKKKEIENLIDEDIANKPSYSVADVRKILGGTIKGLKEKLDGADADTIAYFVRVAKDMKLDSAGKQKLLADLSNVPADILFEEK